MSDQLGLVIDEAFLAHRNPPGHPERSERIGTLLKLCGSGRTPARPVSPIRAERGWIERVHDPEHYRLIESTRGRPHTMLDPDTHAGPDSFDTACLAAGSGVALLQAIMGGSIRSGFALVRPPGHHAETNRPMGFCLFNNVAVTAQWARDEGLADRVAIVDFDVHHGNGTQDIFESREDVLFISSHQFPLYPGTGRMEEVGTGPGEGYTVNLPLPPGKGDAFVVPIYRDVVLPVLEEYEPDLIIVSAGFDAHARDPLAGMMMSESGFSALTSLLVQTARSLCAGKILFSLEGGYDLEALSSCVEGSITSVLEPKDPPIEPGNRREHEAYLERVATCLKRYWKSLEV